MRSRSGGAGTRTRLLLHRGLFFVCALLVIASAGCARANSGSGASRGPIHIALHPAVSRTRPAYIAVTGLTSEELTTLRRRPATDAEWAALLAVTVAAGSAERTAPIPPVQGRYAATDSVITFTPLFPFDPGRSYHVVFDPARLPVAHQRAADASDLPVSAVVSLPAVAIEPTTVVAAVYPASDVVPENLLRVYIEFSAPMGSGAGVDFVKLVELTGPRGEIERVETGAF